MAGGNAAKDVGDTSSGPEGGEGNITLGNMTGSTWVFSCAMTGIGFGGGVSMSIINIGGAGAGGMGASA